MLPGFRNRLLKEVTALYDENVIKKHGNQTKDPIRWRVEDYGLRKPLLAYMGGVSFAESLVGGESAHPGTERFNAAFMTREDFFERGAAYCAEKFDYRARLEGGRFGGLR